MSISIKNYALHLLKTKEKDDVTEIRIHIEKYKVVLRLQYFCSPFCFNIEYYKEGEDTHVECRETKEEIDFKKHDFVAVFCKDLVGILQKQKTVLKRFKLEFGKKGDESDCRLYLYPIGSRIFRALENGLESRGDQKMQASWIDLEVTEMNEIKSVLLNVDPTKLKWLKLNFQQDDISIKEILGMEQLEQTKTFTFKLKMATSELFVIIKEKFFKFPTIDRIIINYQNIDRSQLDNLFGNPYQRNSTDRKILIPNTEEEFLKVTDYDGASILFYRSVRYVEHNISKGISSLSLNNKEGPYLKVFCNPLLMKKILEYAQGFTIQRMRHVSREFRDYIDGIKADPQIKKISIDWKKRFDREINCEITFRNDDKLRFQYDILGIRKCSENEKETQLRKILQLRNRQHFSIGENFCIEENFETQAEYESFFFLRNLELSLRIQKSCLEEIYLDWTGLSKKFNSEFLHRIKETLQSRNPKLKVKKINMEVLCQNEVLEILPYLDPNFLKVIEIRFPYDRKPENPMEVNELSKLEQWIQAEELKIDKHEIPTPIQEMNLTHFAKVEISVNTISSEDIIFLKERLLVSSTFDKFRINIYSVDDNLYEFLNDPFRRTDKMSIWYFRNPNSPYQILHIIYHVSRAFLFSRVKLSSVPENALPPLIIE